MFLAAFSSTKFAPITKKNLFSFIVAKTQGILLGDLIFASLPENEKVAGQPTAQNYRYSVNRDDFYHPGSCLIP